MTYDFSAASQALREDPPVPALTYSLDAASYDLGMRIDPATGAFRWTPARGQSGKYSATIMVRDDVSDPSHPLASETIAITVGDVVNLPSGKIGGLVLRRNGDNLELVGASYSKQTYWTAPAQEVFKLTIRGRANAADTLTVDYTNGPLDIENGVVFDAKNGAAADTLVIKGAPGDDAVEIAAGRVVFNGTQYTLRGVENVTVDTGRGNDTVAIAGLGANVTWIDSAGTDLLNFSQAAGSLNLNLDVPSRQRIFAGNSRTLTLRTIVEDVIGTAQADLIKGNKAANRIDGGGGNDTLYGNAGNDVLNGGDGDDWLYGDAGEDTLVGEAGNNVLLGGDGNDVLDAVTGVRTDVVGKNLLIGGKGADTFQGGIGEELLIGGTTNYDNNAKALAAVMRAWATDKTFEQRCSLLEKGSTDPTAGFIQVKPRSKSSTRGTVLDDSARDLLYGRSDPDWFFGFGKDETDRGAADR
jgi:Ca2+-binding RTX toxin-like protein